MPGEEPGDTPPQKTDRSSTGGSVENTVKDPKDWKTGDEPITGAQESYVETLAEGAGEEVDTSELTKAEASEVIDDLQNKQG